MKLYRMKSLNGESLRHVLDALVNYLPHRRQMNDPAEGRVGIIQENSEFYIEVSMLGKLESKLDDTRFASFTTSVHNILLWAHYADGFSGIAIEYDFDVNQHHIREVTYSDETNLTTIEEANNVIDGKIPVWDTMLLTTKSAAWKYENEWRIFGDKAHIHIKPSSIIFGYGDSVKNRKSEPHPLQKLCKRLIIPRMYLGGDHNRLYAVPFPDDVSLFKGS